jgi:hypothetical protein
MEQPRFLEVESENWTQILAGDIFTYSEGRRDYHFEKDRFSIQNIIFNTCSSFSQSPH